jgi:transposase
MVKYSDEFRRDAVGLVRAGASQREVCRDLGVSKSSMSKWCADAERVAQGLPAAKDLPAGEDARVRELMRRNKLLEQENEVLRRAAAYLSQIHITPPK